MIDLGIAADALEDIKTHDSNYDVDIIIPIGGASVGDYDLMKQAFGDLRFLPIFDKVAVKPGKPTWLSKRDKRIVLGLPGNPVSAWVCAHLFLAHLLGRTPKWNSYPLELALPANGKRETYIRAKLSADGLVTPPVKQDSGLIMPLLQTQTLIKRSAFAESATAMKIVECLAAKTASCYVLKGKPLSRRSLTGWTIFSISSRR